MKQVTFYYCIHGETLFNSARRLQGWCDSPLTDNGRNQMIEASRALRLVPFNAAYVSTSECCRDSLEILMSGRDLPVTYLKSLKEEFYGTLEGILIPSRQEEIDHVRSESRDWSRYGGESIANIRHRIKEIYRKIYERCSDMDRILIVSHSEIFLDLLNVFLDIPYEKLLDHFGAAEKEAFTVSGFMGTICCREGNWDLLTLNGTEPPNLRRLKESSGKRLTIL